MAQRHQYTENEIKWLKENYASASWAELIGRLKISKASIITKASSLGLKRTNVLNGRYTQEEDNLLKELYNNSIDSQLEKNTLDLINNTLPHRTLKSIQARAVLLGLKVRKEWTQDDDEFLINNHLCMTVNELTDHFDNHSRESVYNRIMKLGLTGGPMFAYTNEDKEFICSNYTRMTDVEIGEHLNRASGSIKEMRRKLGLQKPKQDGIIYELNTFLHRNNAEWKKASAARCGYKCIITGSDFDDIHHLYSRNLIIQEMLSEHPEIVIDLNVNRIDNDKKDHILSLFLEKQIQYPLGVCLTHEVHMDFHMKYGFGNNTPEQFVEYVRSIAPDKLDMLDIA